MIRLPTRFGQVHAFQQAAKLNNRWAYSPFRWRPTHPSHPAGKASLICVTRAGQIKLMYQNMDGKWAEVPAELKNTGYSDRLLTHAAMVATQGWHLPFPPGHDILGWLTDPSRNHPAGHLFCMPENLPISSGSLLESQQMGSHRDQDAQQMADPLPAPPSLQSRYA